MASEPPGLSWPVPEANVSILVEWWRKTRERVTMAGRGRSDSGIETPQSRRKYLLCVCDILIQLSRAGPGAAFFPIIPGPGKLIHQTWHRWHNTTRGHGNGARYIELELSINTMNDNSTITSCLYRVALSFMNSVHTFSSQNFSRWSMKSLNPFLSTNMT